MHIKPLNAHTDLLHINNPSKSFALWGLLVQRGRYGIERLMHIFVHINSNAHTVRACMCTCMHALVHTDMHMHPCMYMCMHMRTCMSIIVLWGFLHRILLFVVRNIGPFGSIFLATTQQKGANPTAHYRPHTLNIMCMILSLLQNVERDY